MLKSEFKRIPTTAKAADRLDNAKKFNGIEFDKDLDLNDYEAHYRFFDPQIGRWSQIDPKIEAGQISESPYAAMSNNPILKTDPLGDLADTCCPTAVKIAKFGLKVAAGIIAVGLGPEDVPADGAAGIALTVIEAAAGAVSLWELVTASSPVENLKKAQEVEKEQTETKTKEQTKESVATKKDKVDYQTQGEKAQDQLEGIEIKQQKEKKTAPPGAKQNKIRDISKSQQKLKTELNKIKSLKDAQDNF